MDENLKVSSYVTIREGCPMSYRVHDCDDVDFTCGTVRDGFEFVFDAEALRSFLSLGAEALHEMDALRAAEDA